MNWTEVNIKVATCDTQTAADIITMVSGAGIYIEDYSDLKEQTLKIARVDLIDEELLQKDATISIIHIYLPPETPPAEHISFISDRLKEQGIDFSIDTTFVCEEDWATAWKKYYHPIELSPKLAICPTWEEYTPSPGQHVIKLDPGMAFGTGTHETTQLCLELLEKYMNPGDDMLDIGCGSGILAICSKLLGSNRTVGVDIDPVAVRTAEENCRDNNCDIQIICGDLATDIKGEFSVICANIVADAILRLSPNISPLLAPQGICMVSGIIDTRKDEVINGLVAVGLNVVEILEKSGWVAIACKKS